MSDFIETTEEMKVSLDNSRLNEYGACPQLYDYKYNHGLVDESGMAARYSTYLLHDPVENWYRFKGDYYPDYKLLYQAWAPTTEELLADKFGNYTVKAAESLFKEYTTRFKDDLETYEFIESEVYRTRQVHDDGRQLARPYGSKTDIVLRHRESGDIHTLEIKASKWDFILRSLGFNPQVMGQFWVNKAKRSLVVFFQLTKKPNVERFEFEFMPEEIDTWFEEQTLKISQVVVSEQYNVWPRRTEACSRFNRSCEFLNLCELGGGGSPLVLAKIDEMPKRDPLRYLQEGGE